METHQKKEIAALLCGVLGCICFGLGDWLMIYGDTAHMGTISWLTEGAARIPAWRNSLAMLLAFPGIILYGTALFTIAGFLNGKRQRTVFRYLTAFSLTPWLCLHLFYIMILCLFAWMTGNGAPEALSAAEALFAHLSWLVPLSEIIMLPPYLCWFYLLLRRRSVFPRWMAISNPLIFYGILKLAAELLPDSAGRIGFINGLMSESMVLWFAGMIVWSVRSVRRTGR